jgi:hypothetical protein
LVSHSNFVWGMVLERRNFDFEKSEPNSVQFLLTQSFFWCWWERGELLGELIWSRNPGNLPGTKHRGREGKGMERHTWLVYRPEKSPVDVRARCMRLVDSLSCILDHTLHTVTQSCPPVARTKNHRRISSFTPLTSPIPSESNPRFWLPLSFAYFCWSDGLWILSLNPALVGFSAGCILFRSS